MQWLPKYDIHKILLEPSNIQKEANYNLDNFYEYKNIICMNDLEVLLTGNIREDLNVGGQINYLNSIGHYAFQEAKVINGDVFLSYSGENYAIHGAFDFSKLSNFENGGIVNPDKHKQIARHETECTLDDITKTAAKLLRFGGRFCICQRPERLTDVLLSMRNSGIEPKKLRLVQQRKDKAPKLFLAEGTVRNGISKLLEKLKLKDRTQLAVFAIKNNIV